ncbi:MAG: hypothetical protein K1X88_24665 [Nannocystaceae bacterium]|nr:hypothetical protein [Nannocystaceae bacterium]
MLASTFALAVAIAPASPSKATAPSRPAAEAAEAALRHYEAGELDEARAAIERAYMIEPWPEFLYARAQIERADDRCGTAREFYRLYLDAEPPQAGATAAREGIAACEGRDDPADAPAPAPTPARGRKVDPRHDPIGLSLVGLGGAAAVVGVSLLGAMAHERRAALRAQQHDSFGAHYDRARRLSVGAVALVSIGAALLLAGTVRLATVGRDAKRRRRATARVLSHVGLVLPW